MPLKCCLVSLYSCIIYHFYTKISMQKLSLFPLPGKEFAFFFCFFLSSFREQSKAADYIPHENTSRRRVFSVADDRSYVRSEISHFCLIFVESCTSAVKNRQLTWLTCDMEATNNGYFLKYLVHQSTYSLSIYLATTPDKGPK